MTEERDYYQPLKSALEAHIRATFRPRKSDPLPLQMIAELTVSSEKIYLEITADTSLSNTLKSKISHGRDLIYFFLKNARPDLTGFIEVEDTVDFIVVEFKDNTLNLDNVYQLKKYADLLDAKYSLLVSTDEIPVEVKRLRDVVPELLSRATGHRRLTLVHYNPVKQAFLEWFPEDPFRQGD